MTTEKLDELSIASFSAPASSGTAFSQSATVIQSDDAPDDSMVIGDPAEQSDRIITVYASSITPVSYSSQDSVVSFDIIFSVGINSGGESKTYQVVKRIGIDKEKIASQAESGTPVSIVEAKAVKEEATKEPVISEAKRLRRLAGLE